MTFTITVLYPREAEVDVDYYINGHIPLAERLAGKNVLLSWEVFTFPADAPYCVQANMTWSSAEAQAAAVSGEDGKVMVDDIKKFAKVPPIVMTQQFVAKSSSG
ncbi:hypothetical protein FE257_011239 [Aspergillus nanangensis]|uniref:EthD domain-containing protein n=1 Tax=Aspergillus nanangensis TaxID=2582783 RepID=A0AAD4CHJ2_ASPNN|nr:hypothetical protein FE257_011239 [Aspergillus nanangensis]